MARGDEDASARARVWRRRTSAGGEWWEPEEGAPGVLERGSAEARGRVAISFGVPCLLVIPRFRGGVLEPRTPWAFQPFWWMRVDEQFFR